MAPVEEMKPEDIPEIKNLKESLDRLRKLGDESAPKKLDENNWFNLHLAKLHGDIVNLHVIASRLKNDTEPEETGVDIKSVYLFSKVFADDFTYVIANFLQRVKGVDINGIDIKNLGNFVRDMSSLKNNTILEEFWACAGTSFKELHKRLDYRSYIAHTRESTTEWTMQDHAVDMYENAYLENLSWAGYSTKSANTTTPKVFLFELDGIYTSVINCLDIFLKSKTEFVEFRPR